MKIIKIDQLQQCAFCHRKRVDAVTPFACNRVNVTRVTHLGRTSPRPPSVFWTSKRPCAGDSSAPATTRCRHTRPRTARPADRARRTGPSGTLRPRTRARRNGTRPSPPERRTRRRRSLPSLVGKTKRISTRVAANGDDDDSRLSRNGARAGPKNFFVFRFEKYF